MTLAVDAPTLVIDAEFKALIPPLTPEEAAHRESVFARSQHLTPNNFIYLPHARLKRCTGEQLDGILDPKAERQFAARVLELATEQDGAA